MGNDASVPKLSPEDRLRYEQQRASLAAYNEAENVPQEDQHTSRPESTASREWRDQQLVEGFGEEFGEGFGGTGVSEHDAPEDVAKARSEQSSREESLVVHTAAAEKTATFQSNSGMNGATTPLTPAKEQARNVNGSNALSSGHIANASGRGVGEKSPESEPSAFAKKRHVTKISDNISNPARARAGSKEPTIKRGGAATSTPPVTASSGLPSRKSSCAGSESDVGLENSHNSASTKRPSVSEGRRELTGISAQKRKKKAPESQSSGQTSPQLPVSMKEREYPMPPEWYTKMLPNKTRDKDTANADILLARIKDYINEVKMNKSGALDKLRESLHEAPFLDMRSKGPKLVRNHRMLDNNFGLPRIFDERYSDGVYFPPDVRSDARELYQKWCAKDFETDMLRGILMSTSKADSIHGISVASDYKQDYKYQGNGKLVNGQWWPLLPCAVRDGAHGEYVAGISGEVGIGAYSCFISGGKDHVYNDIDKGNLVEYYGQDSKDPGKVARGTELMQLSYNKKIPVRFIRSSKAASEFAPKIGFRYDGLYDITGCELEDDTKQRYRFRLERRPVQGPIRGGNGPESRPTRQEVEHYQQDKRFRGSS